MSKDKINNYFTKKLSCLPVSAKTHTFDQLMKKSIDLSGMGIDSDEKFKKYFILKSAAKSIGAKLSFEENKELLNLKINNINDAYYNIVGMKAQKNNIKKVAYPNTFGYRDDIENEFNVNNWLKVVHLIYDSVANKEMTKQNALDYYSNFLNIEEDEDEKFKKWFKYYSDGEHLKYSSKEDEDMKKKAVYISDMGQGNSPYYSGGGSAYLGENTGYNMPGDSLDQHLFDHVSSNANKAVEDKDVFSNWKGKLHTAIRRIDKLLRTDRYMDSDTYRNLAENLMNLSLQVHTLKLANTITDVTYKAANKFTKLGHTEGAEILKKIAQEVPEQPPLNQGPDPRLEREEEVAPAAPVAGVAEEALPAEAPSEEGVEPEAEEAGPTSGIPKADTVEPAALESIKPIPGARPGEYEELAGDIGLDDAATKLDEVAGMLADRRIIRQLAEFDIMLDRLGIASMFPELAESQSKLIDAYSYALTRVTKMMGQLANAKTLVRAQTGIPGAAEEVESAEEVAPAPEQEVGEEELVAPELPA
mgnify:CR=1 FL=1